MSNKIKILHYLLNFNNSNQTLSKFWWHMYKNVKVSSMRDTDSCIVNIGEPVSSIRYLAIVTRLNSPFKSHQLYHSALLCLLVTVRHAWALMVNNIVEND